MLGENSSRDIKPTYCDSPALNDLNWRSEPEKEIDADREPEIKESVFQDQTTAPGTVVNNNPFFLNISGGTNTVYGHVDKVEIKNGRSDADE